MTFQWERSSSEPENSSAKIVRPDVRPGSGSTRAASESTRNVVRMRHSRWREPSYPRRRLGYRHMAVSPSLGDFEQLVLLALVRLGDQAYGVTIHNEIVRRARRDVTVAAVYKTLERLELKGFAVSTVGEPTAERGGRRKKHFRIQPAGRRALAHAGASLPRTAHGLTDV